VILVYTEAVLRLFCQKTGMKFEDSMLNWSDDDGFEARVNEAPWPADFKIFFEGTIQSRTFHAKRSPTDDPTEYPPEIHKAIQENQVWYEKLLSVATRV
jgi:hypothetical protein